MVTKERKLVDRMLALADEYKEFNQTNIREWMRDEFRARGWDTEIADSILEEKNAH